MPTEGLPHLLWKKSPTHMTHMKEPAEGSVDLRDYQNVSETTSEPCFNSKPKYGSMPTAFYVLTSETHGGNHTAA